VVVRTVVAGLTVGGGVSWWFYAVSYNNNNNNMEIEEIVRWLKINISMN
jgi:hypothetical protein